jgi:hypothetical protein
VGQINWDAYSKGLDASEESALRSFPNEIKRVREIVAKHVNRVLAAAIALGGDNLRDELGALRHGEEGLRRTITRKGLRVPTYIDASDLLLTIACLVLSNSYGGNSKAAHKAVADLTDEYHITATPAYTQVHRIVDKRTEDPRVYDAVFLLGWQIPVRMIKLP